MTVTITLAQLSEAMRYHRAGLAYRTATGHHSTTSGGLYRTGQRLRARLPPKRR